VLLDALEVLPDPHRRAAAGPLIPSIPFDGGEVVWWLAVAGWCGFHTFQETTMINGLAWAGLE
jgi:hypothetical protein